MISQFLSFSKKYDRISFMKKIVFDIETKNIFTDVGSNNPADLDISIVSLYDYETNKYYSFLQDDFEKMWPFFKNAEILITFNGDHFDIPLLQKYCSFDLKNIQHLDIFAEVQKITGKKIGLDNIATTTLKIAKSANGLDAVAWWNSGEIEKIKKYCEQDVKVTKDIYEFAKKNNFLKYKDLKTKKIVEVQLNSSNWEIQNTKATQSSMLF